MTTGEIMSRKPQYSIEEVFEAAIPLVLAKGYRGCSMETLINATGFNRRAFYKDFSDKQGFMNALLAYYIEQHLLPLQKPLVALENIPQAIVEYFISYQSLIDRQGCLLVRLLVELGKENTSIVNQARRYFDNLQLTFIGCLERAITHNELNPNTQVESLALKLSCFAQGFAVSNNIQQGDSDTLIVIKSLFEAN
jgi:TetR/AcrR family transcriptional repressor of nem operon